MVQSARNYRSGLINPIKSFNVQDKLSFIPNQGHPFLAGPGSLPMPPKHTFVHHAYEIPPKHNPITSTPPSYPVASHLKLITLPAQSFIFPHKNLSFVESRLVKGTWLPRIRPPSR
jgi:hypothetical protein